MMPTIKSLDDLKRIREEALHKRQAKVDSGSIEIIVGMGTPGIAAGARETMKAILDFIEKESVNDVIVRQTGNIGLDSWEPIVQVMVGNNPRITYGRVKADVARRIMREHVLGGNPVKEFIIEQ
ncbi:MAG: (2Fe-2S) ferredoxin domain-containing protein [Chloroflexota bacterium]|jgi:NADP-reducing hydrogenase subunit HndB